MRFVKIGFIVILTLYVLAWYFNKEEHTHTSMFCAYGILFVEFEEEKSKWGTIMLDREGRPMPCNTEKKTIEHIGV